jgi:hypothetical protein
MIEKDYIMRLIQQLVAFLAKILFNKSIKQYEQAFLHVDEALQQLLGLTLDDALTLPMAELERRLLGDEGEYAEKCFVLAELLREEGEIAELSKRQVFMILQSYERALTLYITAARADERFNDSSQHNKIRNLAKRLLEDPAFDADSCPAFFDYYFWNGEYAKAENVLFRLLQEGPKGLMEKGRAFYANLAEKSEELLQAGGLSRQEVEEGLHSLERFS